MKRLDLYVDEKSISFIPEDVLFSHKLYYWAITSLVLSEYKVFLDNLDRQKFLFRFLKAKKYVSISSESSEDDLNHFMRYFIKCLMDDMESS